MNKAQELMREMDEAEIFIPKGNLGLARRDMPQVEEKDLPELIAWLKTKKVGVTRGKVSAKSLKPIQKEINADVVKLMAGDNAPKRMNINKPVLLTKKDSYIIDGHHRWLAKLERDKESDVDAFQVDMRVREFLNLMMTFPKVIYKDTNRKVFDKPLVKKY
jgi:hypothetical protein